MKLTSLVALATASLLATATAQDGKFYLLKRYEPNPGQVVVHKSLSNSQAGRMTVTDGSSVRRGTISLTRARSLERRILGTGPKIQLQYKVIADQLTRSTELGIDKETEVVPGALVGRTVFGFHNKTMSWRLFLKGQTANTGQAHAIAELEAYENRRLFMEAPVQVGQTWPIDPAFIRHLTERDLGKVKINANMTFTAVEQIDNEPTAVLTFKVETLGSKSGPEGGKIVGGTAAIAVTGVLHISLKTMLDKKLTMTGSLTTMASEGTASTLVTLPVDLTVTKTVH